MLVNPEIISEKGCVTKFEECFSIPDHVFIVTRPQIVKCRGLNLNGESVTIKGRDSLARLLKHEVDHLDGILIDKIAERRLY
ncbi:Peptide deformylase [subsurface metagenome]